MAECLATSPVMSKDFSFIYVSNEANKKSIENIIEKSIKIKNRKIKSKLPFKPMHTFSQNPKMTVWREKND